MTLECGQWNTTECSAIHSSKCLVLWNMTANSVGGAEHRAAANYNRPEYRRFCKMLQGTESIEAGSLY
jgi:hypothetical protein